MEGHGVLGRRSLQNIPRCPEIVGFVLVGGTSALLYVVLNVIFTSFAGFRPGVAVVLSLCVLMPPTYLAQRRLAFRSSSPHTIAFPRYVATQAFGNLVGIAAAEFASPAVHAFPWLMFTGCAIIVAGGNYILLKFWAFSHERRQA